MIEQKLQSKVQPREVSTTSTARPIIVYPERTRDVRFGGLIASTVHILAMHVSLGVKGEHATAAIAGLGMTNLLNHAPVRPGDVLSHVNEVIDRRPSKSRPGAGIVTFRNTLSNQHGAAVFSYENAALIRFRDT